jgi:hypothetical protein
MLSAHSVTSVSRATLFLLQILYIKRLMIDLNSMLDLTYEEWQVTAHC